MKEKIRQIILQYGSVLQLEHQGQVLEFRGFLQPVRTGALENAEYKIQEPGQYPAGRFTFIGPPDIPAAQGDRLGQGERWFQLRRAEPYYVGDEQLYWWGLCTEEGADTWTA